MPENIRNMRVEDIVSLGYKDILSKLVRAKIATINENKERLENQQKESEMFLENEKAKFEIPFNLNKDREISNQEFNSYDKRHKHILDAYDLKRLSIEKEMKIQNSILRRINCLLWLLKFPKGKDSIEIVKGDRKETISKEDVYAEFVNIVIDSEKSKLQYEQSILRLQIDFMKIPEYPVHPEHEFYIENHVAREKLEEVKDKISIVNQIERKNNSKSTPIDLTDLTIQNFIDDSSELLLEDLFLDENEKRQAM